MKCLILLVALSATPLAAQTAGETGAYVLQFNAGSRAAALSGAYSSAYGDADALFFNPAGIAAMGAGATVSYESHAADIALGSLGAFTRFGSLRVGASLVYLDAGTIAEIIPDAEFGFSTGTATGIRASAGEIAGRLSMAQPLFENRLRVGASLGFVSVNVAEVSETAPIADVGIQYDVALMTFAVAARNLGGTLGAADRRLPTEVRVGALVPVLNTAGVGANFFVDGIARVHESAFDFAGGVEVGLVPNATRPVGAVLRAGYDGEAGQLGALRLGAGLSLRSASVDYTFRSMEIAGSVHRLGVRWSAR